MKICVFCSSSNYLDKRYYEEARNLGTLLGNHNHHLVYGGTHIGLMGELAQSAKNAGATITGVIPQLIYDKNLAADFVDELIITSDLRERKAVMECNADAFLALPGGFGTLEELFEIITLKQLGLHQKAVVLINTLGYFNPLIDFASQMAQQKFVNQSFSSLYHVADNSADALSYIASYQPLELVEKWNG